MNWITNAINVHQIVKHVHQIQNANPVFQIIEIHHNYVFVKMDIIKN